MSFIFLSHSTQEVLEVSEPDSVKLTTYDAIEGSYMYDKIASDKKKAVAYSFKSLSERLGVPYKDILTVCYMESGLDHTARNPKMFQDSTYAYGYIQWTPIARRQLGITYWDLVNMSEFDQIELMYEYLSLYIDKVNSFADLYMSVYLPAYLGRPDSTKFPDKFVLNNKTLGSSVGEFKAIVTNRKNKYEKANF